MKKIKNVKTRHLLLFIVTLYFFLLNHANGQDVTLGLSETYDQNIFDTYSPLKDLVTEFKIDVSKGWGFNYSYLGFYYGGALNIYKDLTERNYHSHIGVIGWIYHFPPAQKSEEDSEESDDENLEESEESDESDEEADSTDNNVTEDVTEKEPSQKSSAPVTVHSDSLDRYLYIAGIGATQFNKTAYEQWDHSSASAIITFRQPLGISASIRPSYTFIYHSYPNLSVLTNIQHVLNLHLGTDIVPKSWICLTGSFGYKAYTVSQTGQDTIFIIKPAHGKSGTVKIDTVLQYDFTTPSLCQPWISAHWIYKPVSGTEGSLQFTYYMNPTSTARALPTLRSGASVTTNFDQNELYDDHFSFNGIEIELLAQQTVPLGVIIKPGLKYQHKKYTYSAKDLSGTVVAPNRIDDRLQISMALLKSFSLGKSNKINLIGEYSYLRNGSNSAYFIFNKNKFKFGVEYSF